MPSRSVRVLAAVVVLTSVAASLISCEHSPVDSHGGQSGSGGVQAGQPAAHNAADVTFADNMLPHHQQGVLLAAMVPAHTLNPDLRVIAAHIAADQQAEIETLNLLLAQWHEHPDPGHDMMGMAGMVDQATLDRLQTLDGAAFDTLWAKSMISHHQGAVTMAQAEIAHGQSADAIHTATLIVEAQQREIATMTHLISSLQ